MQIGRHAAFSNPLFWLHCAGLQGPYTAWAVSRGALVDLRDRPVNIADFGDVVDRVIARKAFPGIKIDDQPVLR